MRIPKSAYNWLSAIGLILSLNCILLMIVLFIISLTVGAKQYLPGNFHLHCVTGSFSPGLDPDTSRDVNHITEKGQGTGNRSKVAGF